jgi:hypothetical protein
VFQCLHREESVVDEENQSYMLGVADDEINLAIQLLLNAGFIQQTWPYSSTEDPATFAGHRWEAYCRIQASVAPGFAKLTRNSSRFHYPDKRRCGVRVVLLPSSYIHLGAPESLAAGIENSTEGTYNAISNVYYPVASILLESFIRVYLKDDKLGGWGLTLRTWIISYMYGQLGLGNDILDRSEDTAVKEWWNKEIDRDHGGLDMRCTKYDGRVS